jgi:formylglycine-generating enzyme required for sulfatase activity
MIQLLDHELLLRIALTLVHVLWQGVAIGAVAAIAATVLRRSSASSRYVLYSVALLCLPICVAVTLATVETPDAWREFGTESTGQTVSPAMTKELAASADGIASYDSLQPSSLDDFDNLIALSSRSESGEPVVAESRTAMPDKRADTAAAPLFAQLSPAIVLAYVAGVSWFLLRLVAGAWGGHRLRVASIPIDNPSLLKLVAEQSCKVGLRIVPAVAICERVAVPMVVGALRPVVLLPASIVSGLAPEQFAAIISHELAHIRRFDLLMNLLQRLIESLLFFHPAVWYISRRMSAEREACCDDLVVSSGYAPMDYAGALLRMAELCSSAGQSGAIAVAASGHNATQFELRIKRLMNRRAESRLRLTRAGVIMIALLMISVAVTPAAFRNWAQAQDEGKLNQVVASAAADIKPQEAPEPRTAEQAASSVAASPIDMELKLIEAGSFLMGCPADQVDIESDEKPQRRVRISKPFLVGQTEVTQSQWKAVMGTSPWKGKKSVREGSDYPATHVTWEGAVAFCKRLGQREGETYRLPTEAEWEYACRAGTLTNYSFGDDGKKLGDYAWHGQYTEGSERYAHRVATKLPNPWGLYDMHGNVSEYCQDWYGKYDEEDTVDPLLSHSPPSSLRVMRGGHWLRTSKWCRSSERDPIGLSSTSSMWGFRVVREAEELTAATGDEAGGLRSPEVHKAIAEAAKFLETRQRDDGTWRIGVADWQNDGATALCALALLRAGQTPEDEALKRAVNYLVTVEPEHTYTIALQTILFCELDAKKYLAHIRRNVKWLIDSQSEGRNARGGWSYSVRSSRSDGSNTRFAVWALDVAQRDGVDVPNDTWRSVADYWLSLQLEDGSWPYQVGGIPRSPNMTLAGIASLSVARPFVLAENEEGRQEIDASIQRAWKWHDEQMPVLDRWRTIHHRFYGLQSLALAGDKTNRGASGDWYPKMAALLLREQDQAKGSWTGTGAERPAIATSLAMLALTEADAGEKQDEAPTGGSPDEKSEHENAKQTKGGEKVQVLLVDRAPRWSFRYLRNVLQRDETIEVKSVLSDTELPNSLQGLLNYDVIVLGDVEPSSLGRKNIENIERFVRDYGRAIILIAGDTHLPWSYTDSPLASLFPIDLKTASRPDKGVVQPIVPQEMRELPMLRLAKDKDTGTDVMQNLPKLSVKAEVKGLKTGAEVWVSSSKGEDQMPLIARWKYGIGDVVFLATDETWRWRTTKDGEDVHKHFWTKTMRYLAQATREGDQPSAENTVELDAENLKTLRIKYFLEALTDKNTEPIWGKTVNGLQIGIVGIQDGQRFQPGAKLRFALLLRNTSKETIRCEYEWPENCFWIAPSVVTGDGEPVRVVAVNFRGGHKQFTETLAPKAVSLVMLQGMLGLGEKARSTKWSPYIDDPKPGKYRLGAGFYAYLVDSDGKRLGKAFFLASGFVNFQMTPEGEAEAQPPASRDAVRSRIELYEESFRLQGELANGLPTTREGIERVFQRALGRKPTDDELSATLKSVLKLLSKDPELQKRTKMTPALQEWLKAGIESEDEFDKFIREQLSESTEEGTGDDSATEQPAEGLPKSSPPYPWPDQLVGTVTDTEGRGIAKAAVKLTIEEHFRDGTDFAERTLKAFRATTDASGKYIFDTTGWPSPAIDREYSVMIRASAPGAAPWETWLFGTKGDRDMPESLPDVKLPPGRVIAGQCIDASGEPVAGVVIRGQSAFNQQGRWHHQHQTTDNDGRFQVIAPEGHAAVLWCISTAAGYQRVEIPASSDKTLKVVMRGGTSLVGQVESAGGAPVAGTLVVLEKHEPGTRQGYVATLRLATKTNEEGRFRMPPLHGEFACFVANASLSDELPNRASLFAARTAPPVVPIRVSLDGQARQQEIKLRESRTVLLSGTVRYEDDRPAAGVRIRVYSGGARLGTPISGKDGRYSIRIPATKDRVNLGVSGTQDHRPKPAQHAPGEHQNSYLILQSLTEDVTDADYVMTSRNATDAE